MSHLSTLVASAIGQKAAATILDVLDIAPPLAAETDGPVSRAVFAMALNAVLFHDIMGRVPLGAAYVSERRAAGRKVLFDHGALRTIDFGDGAPTGALPAGHLAFARILEPLGYAVADLYPLDRLKMTGRAYAHLDHPEAIPQFFVSAVSVEPSIMAVARQGTNGKETDNALSVAFVKDPTSPAWRKDKAVALYKSIMKRYFPSGRVSDVYNWYGMTVAFSLVDALKHAGRNPTRDSLRRAMTHMDEHNNPFLLPGVAVKTSPANYFPIAKARMIGYRKNLWVLFGPLVKAQ